MEIFDPTDLTGFLGVLVEIWQTSGRVGPIVAIAVAVIASVHFARLQLTQWIPWLATRHGALFLVALFAVGNSAGLAALEGETSLLAILLQAGAAAVTAIGLRSGTKAAKTGGAATIEGWFGEEKVLVMKHEHVRPPKDPAAVPSEGELARIIREEGEPRR